MPTLDRTLIIGTEWEGRGVKPDAGVFFMTRREAPMASSSGRYTWLLALMIAMDVWSFSSLHRVREWRLRFGSNYGGH